MRRAHSWFCWGILIVALLFAVPLQAEEANAQRRPVVAQQGPRMDVVFVIDATGSMADEIGVVKKQIWEMAEQMMDGTPRPDIRFGLVFYRDVTDSQVIEKTELTRDVEKAERHLKSVAASGGGDWEEHVGRGLHEALGLEWDTSRSVTRLVYLVGDAPPHHDYDDGFSIKTALARAAEMGVVIHSIGGSGLNNGASEFEKIAMATDGTFKYLTYHTVVADADGTRSVIYEGGEYYEADEVLSDAEWQKGAAALKKKQKVRTAARSVSAKAASSSSIRNNLDAVVEESVMGAASEAGVTY